MKEAPNEFDLYRDPGELWVADLESGRSEPLVRGLQALDYDISADGQQVVMETMDLEGKPRLWVARGRSEIVARTDPECGGSVSRDSGRAAKSSFATWKGRPSLCTAFAGWHRIAEGARKTCFPHECCLTGRPLDLCLGSASRQRNTSNVRPSRSMGVLQSKSAAPSQLDLVA